MVDNASKIITVNLIDEITVTADAILAMMIGIGVIITATTAAMTDTTTTVVTTALISAIKVIIVMIATMIVTMTGATTDVARTITTAKTTTARSGHLRHRPKWATPMVHSRRPTARLTSLSVVAKRSKSTGRLDRMPGRSGTSTLKIHDLYAGVNSQITFSRKDHWVHIPDPGTYPLVVNLIINGAWLPKTLVDGGSSLNIIFTETLRKMEFDFSKMTACDEPFFGVVPGKATYPIGRVCLLVTFGIEENFRTEYLTFEVADCRSSNHAIFGRPMLAKFMAIPHHTYLIMKMPAPNGILSVLGDIMVSYNCESATVELSKDSAIKATEMVMVAQAAKIDQTTLQVPE
jgi:hypothetical protein